MKTVICGLLFGLILGSTGIKASEDVQTISLDTATTNSLACYQYALDFIEYIKLRPYIKERLSHLFTTKVIPEKEGRSNFKKG